MSEEDEINDQPQPLVAHLSELRDRLLRAILAVLVNSVAAHNSTLPSPSTLPASRWAADSPC